MAKQSTPEVASTELTTQPNMDLLKSLGRGALDNLSTQDIVMPRYKLVQNTSKTGTPGRWVSNVNADEHTSLEGVILAITQYRVMFPKQGEGDRPVCKSNDGVTKASPDGIGDSHCASCRYNVWTGTGAVKTPPPCRAGYTILALIKEEDGSYTPGMISIKGSSIKGAKQFFTQMRTRGVAPFAYLTKFLSVSEVNAKGRFFKIVMEFGDWLPESDVLSIAQQAGEYVQFAKSSATIDDYEDEFEQPAVPTSTGAAAFVSSLGGGGDTSFTDFQ